MSDLTHLSLFTGIGGLDLAAEAAGFRTVGQCEWADYPTKVLEKHWPDVPRWRDIRTLTGENFYERTGLRTVDIISGGFPCQPFSTAGKRRGCEDDRYLWPEMQRIIEELRPRWIVGENVAGIVNMALDQVLSDLEIQGYKTRAFVFPACAVDAPHRRDRCAVLAYANGSGLQGSQQHGASDQGREAESHIATCKCCEAVYGSHNGSGERRPVKTGIGRSIDGLSDWMDEVRSGWADGTWETGIPRTATGVPDRVPRLKCLGNAVVPQMFYPVFQAIAKVNRERFKKTG